MVNLNFSLGNFKSFYNSFMSLMKLKQTVTRLQICNNPDYPMVTKEKAIQKPTNTYVNRLFFYFIFFFR